MTSHLYRGNYIQLESEQERGKRGRSFTPQKQREASSLYDTTDVSYIKAAGDVVVALSVVIRAPSS